MWSDLFREGHSTLMTDSVFVALQRSMKTSGDRPWRVEGVQSTAASLWLPTHGRATAESVMGVPSELFEIPYWTSLVRLLGAVGGNYVLTATNLTYPIRVYDLEGVLRDSLTTPPPSWVQARHPALGEFAPEETEPLREYQQSHTVITGLAAVSEDVFLIAHGRLEVDHRIARPEGLVARTLWIDVYEDGRRVVADHPSPGEILAYGQNVVLFLRWKATAGKWQITEYSLRE